MSVSGSECVASVLASADDDREMVVGTKGDLYRNEENLILLPSK